MPNQSIEQEEAIKKWWRSLSDEEKRLVRESKNKPIPPISKTESTQTKEQTPDHSKPIQLPEEIKIEKLWEQHLGKQDDSSWGTEYPHDLLLRKIQKIVAQAHQSGIEQGRREMLDEIIALRSVYVYDDYSSLNQQEKEIWLEYSKVESDFINKKLEALSTSNK